MRRHRALAKLESLSRRELRRIIHALVGVVGIDGLARFVQDAPISPASAPDQLTLAAVDVESVCAKLDPMLALVVAGSRAQSADPSGFAVLSNESVRATCDARWTVTCAEVAAAIRYSPDHGAAVLTDVLAAFDATIHALNLVGVSDPCWLDLDAARRQSRSLVQQLVDATRGAHLNESLLAAVLACAHSASIDEPNELLASLSNGDLTAQVPTLIYIVESTTVVEVQRSAFRLLCAFTTRDTIEHVVTLHALFEAHPAATEALVRAMMRLKRLDEARYWCAQGRDHYPALTIWDDVEATMY